MPSVDQVLAIAGAAEGSFYTASGTSKDVRYKPSFANANSGLSFGVFQFDVATNTQGQAGLQTILRTGVDAKAIDQITSARIFKSASTRNAGVQMKSDDKKAIEKLFATSTAKTVIDALDKQRATTVSTLIESIMTQAEAKWKSKKIVGPNILTAGQPARLRLFAYLLASWNRYPANQGTFEQWLRGDIVKTANGPPAGFNLTAPPTVEQMHTFFKSLRIWDGSQGNYQYLRDRLDPTLKRIGG